MPWSLSQRDGKWCVVKDADGEVEGCHSSRADAIKQQRALYANESRVAAMYAELDERGEAEMEVFESTVLPPVRVDSTLSSPSELVKIEIGKENEVLTASLMGQMERMSERQARNDEALIAALHAIGTRSPVVNVAAPEVSVEAPSVNVEPPSVTIEAPEVTVTPELHVHPEVTVQMPEQAPRTKVVTFERDPLTGNVASAEVTEG